MGEHYDKYFNESQAEGVTDDNPYDIQIFQLWNGRIFRMLYWVRIYKILFSDTSLRSGTIFMKGI